MGVGRPLMQTVDAARSGDERALARMYDELAPAVLGYLRTRGSAAPEVVCGDVFTDLVRELGHFSGGEDDLRARVFGMAHRCVREEDRRRGERSVRPRPIPPTKASERSEASEGDVATRSVIDRLTEAERDVLLLRVFGELSVRGTADVTGRRPRDVKRLERHAFQSLRRHVAGEMSAA